MQKFISLYYLLSKIKYEFEVVNLGEKKLIFLSKIPVNNKAKN